MSAPASDGPVSRERQIQGAAVALKALLSDHDPLQPPDPVPAHETMGRGTGERTKAGPAARFLAHLGISAFFACLAWFAAGSSGGRFVTPQGTQPGFRSQADGSGAIQNRPAGPEKQAMKNLNALATGALSSLAVLHSAQAQSQPDNHVLRLPNDSAAVSIAHAAIQFAPNNAKALTIEYWIRFDSTPVSGRPVCKRGCSNPGYTINVFPNRTGAEFGGVCDESIPTPTGEWYHYAATWSGAENKVRLYMNGELMREVTTSGQNLEQVAQPLTFGAFCNRGFVGAMDNIRIWSVARSDADIRRDMSWEYSSAVAGAIPGLVGAWSFEAGDGSSVLDDSGRNPVGVLSGGANIAADDFLGWSCPSDLDHDGAVTGGDISLLLLDFGTCP
ncbi:MAG: hypothetical protein RL277_2941 [Planctomycetota bacterium]|jgi:hypothetical protein